MFSAVVNYVYGYKDYFYSCFYDPEFDLVIDNLETVVLDHDFTPGNYIISFRYSHDLAETCFCTVCSISTDTLGNLVLTSNTSSTRVFEEIYLFCDNENRICIKSKIDEFLVLNVIVRKI